MFRIRFHGRGGQGIKTASRVLSSAFFREGYEVQDAPRYGAERRGAPIFAFVRASTSPVYERGIIRDPDLVVVTDDSLMGVPAAGALLGIAEQTGLLMASHAAPEIWRARLGLPGPITTLPAGPTAQQTSLTMTGAAARWLGVITRDALLEAVRDELSALGKDAIQEGYEAAQVGFDHFWQRKAASDISSSPSETTWR